MSERVNAAHVSTMTNWGGVERLLIDMLRYVRQETIHHSVVPITTHPELLTELNTVNANVLQPHKFFRYDPLGIVDTARIAHTGSFHIVHSYNFYANLWAAVAIRMIGTLASQPTFVAGERGTIWEIHPLLSPLNRWAYRVADVVIVNSRASKLMISRKCDIDVSRIRVIHNAVPQVPAADIARIRSAYNVESAYVVGSVGRLVPQKNYAALVRAAEIVLKRRSDVYFMLIGGGDLEVQLRQLVQAADIHDNFIMTGWRKNARELMQAFDIFVNTSLYEPFGNVLVEAALAGKTVIAPRIDGIPEVVLDGKTGILLDPKISAPEANNDIPIPHVVIDKQLSEPRSVDPNDLADTILDLLDNQDKRKTLGEAARERAKEKFSIHRYIRDLEDVYSAVAQ